LVSRVLILHARGMQCDCCFQSVTLAKCSLLLSLMKCDGCVSCCSRLAHCSTQAWLWLTARSNQVPTSIGRCSVTLNLLLASCTSCSAVTPCRAYITMRRCGAACCSASTAHLQDQRHSRSPLVFDQNQAAAVEQRWRSEQGSVPLVSQY
jgi:hypothetical protein